VFSACKARAPDDDFETEMTNPEDLYTQRILELAANMPRTDRLAQADATALAHSKLCGSKVAIDLCMEGDRVTDYGQSVRACLLGQTSAAVMGREIVGSSASELRAVGAEMRKMLREGGPPPGGRWPCLSRSGTTRSGTPRPCSSSMRWRMLLARSRRSETAPLQPSRPSA
jgi:NifU-like protein involved in Fe-S cluster formation